MNSSDSESSDFWNLNKTSEKIDIDSSDFWNLEEKQIKSVKSIKLTKPKNESVQININEQENTLPPNQITYSKKIGDFTLTEFYKNFIQSLIDIVKDLVKGRGLNQIFSDNNRLIHFGIFLIIISILLVPLALS